MSNELCSKIDRDVLRKNFLEYTQKAFHLIPKIDHPHILDIGCGSGMQTLELALHSKGKITAIDINEQELSKLRLRVKERNLSDQIQILNCSFRKMDFPDESFDIIWAEGIGGFIEFSSSLKEWKRLIKPGGYLIRHDDARKLSGIDNVVSRYGYITIAMFLLPEEAWWEKYYRPLENQLTSLRKKGPYSPAFLKTLEKHQDEVDSFKKNPQSSGFVILQKQRT